MTFLKKFLKNEDGATAIEYGLIAALIALAIVTGAGLMGDALDEQFRGIASALDGTLGKYDD